MGTTSAYSYVLYVACNNSRVLSYCMEMTVVPVSNRKLLFYQVV